MPESKPLSQPSLSVEDRERLGVIAQHLEVDGNRQPSGILKDNCYSFAAFLRCLASAPPEISQLGDAEVDRFGTAVAERLLNRGMADGNEDEEAYFAKVAEAAEHVLVDTWLNRPAPPEVSGEEGLPHHHLLGTALCNVKHERFEQERLKAEGRFRFTCADQELSLGEKLAILTEEVGEVAQQVLEQPDRRLAFDTSGSRAELRKELTQVAAVAVAWIESLFDEDVPPSPPEPSVQEEGQPAFGLSAEEFDCAISIIGKAAALDSGKPGDELRRSTLEKLRFLSTGANTGLSVADLVRTQSQIAIEQEERANDLQARLERVEAELDEEREAKAGETAAYNRANERATRAEAAREKLEASCGRGESKRSQPSVNGAGEPFMQGHPEGDWVRYLDYDKEVAIWIAATEEKDEERHRERQRAIRAEAALEDAAKEFERLAWEKDRARGELRAFTAAHVRLRQKQAVPSEGVGSGAGEAHPKKSLLISSLRWAISFIDARHRFAKDRPGDSDKDEDWLEHAAALDLLKDADSLPAPPPQAVQGEARERLLEAQADVHQAEVIAAEWAARNSDADAIAACCGRVREFLDDLVASQLSPSDCQPEKGGEG